MLKLITSTVLVAIPATALAHPGHPHSGSEWHHVAEYGAIAAVVIAAACGLRYLRAKRSSRDS